MKPQTIGFIGGGRITRIFLDGWARVKRSLSDILVSDSNAETLDSLDSRFPGISTTSDNARAAGQDLVFLAVHPPILAAVRDLIPVHPLAAMEPHVIETYRTCLPAIYQKIKP